MGTLHGIQARAPVGAVDPPLVRWKLRACRLSPVVRGTENFQRAPGSYLLTCGDECWVAGDGVHAHCVRFLRDVQGPRPEALLLLVLLLLKHEGDALLTDRPRATLRVEVLGKLGAVGRWLVVLLPLQKAPVVLKSLRRVVLVPVRHTRRTSSQYLSPLPVTEAQHLPPHPRRPLPRPGPQACPRKHCAQHNMEGRRTSGRPGRARASPADP